jgi:hypothetical protein
VSVFWGVSVFSECICSTLFQRKNTQFAFFELGGHLGHRLALRTFFLFFFFSAETCAVGGEKKTSKGKVKEYKIKQSKKKKEKESE